MNDTPPTPPRAQTPPVRPVAADRAEQPPRVLASQDLFAGGYELHIEHNGSVYTLRLTSKGKLILTK